MRGTICFIIITTLAFCSCKKDKEEKKACSLINIIRDDGKQNYFFTYNDRAEVSSMVDLPSNSLTTYEYDANKITGTKTKSGKFDSRTISQLNENGFAINYRVEDNEAGTHWNNQEIVYEGRQARKLIITDSGSPDMLIGNFIWEDGNLITQNLAGTIVTYGYYMDRPYQAGDWRSLAQLVNQYHVFETKNLLRWNEVGGIYTFFDYEFDASGKITRMLISSASENFHFNYDYECH